MYITERLAQRLSSMEIELLVIHSGTWNHFPVCKRMSYIDGACGVMVIGGGNGHGDTSSNPKRD